MSTATSWAAIFGLAVASAREVGEELLYRFVCPWTIEFLREMEPVTDTDYAVETIIRQEVGAHYPEHSV